MEHLTEHLGRGLGLILMLSLPAVLTAASVGLVVGILQAVTQVQEQTISAAPKVLSVFLLILIGGGVMMNMLTTYFRESVHLAFQVVPEVGERVLPPKMYDEDKARIKAFFNEQVNPSGGQLNKAKASPAGQSSSQKPGQFQFKGSGTPRHKPSVSEQMILDKNKSKSK